MSSNEYDEEEDYFDVTSNGEEYSYETVSEEDDDDGEGDHERSSGGSRNENDSSASVKEEHSSPLNTSIATDIQQGYFGNQRPDTQSKVLRVKNESDLEREQSHSSDTDSSSEKEARSQRYSNQHQTGRSTKLYCLISVTLVLAIAVGILLGAIFLFDLDVPFLDSDSDDSSSRDESSIPTPSPSITESPQSLTWQVLGEPISRDNTTDGFGSSVALSSSGDVLVVGSPNTRVNGVEVGSVQAFGWNENKQDWQMTSDVIYGDVSFKNIGEIIAVSDNGNVIASCGDWNASAAIVKVFQRHPSGAWNQVGQSLLRQGRGKCPVSLSDDGKVVGFGSKWSWPAGIVQVYRYENDEWFPYGQELQEKTLEEINMGDGWGDSIVFSQDGSIVAASASGGSYVRVFVLDPTTLQWIPFGQTLSFDDAVQQPKIANDVPLSISENGRVLAVGVPHGTLLSGGSYGWIRAYQYNDSTDTWEKLGQTLRGKSLNEQFGFSVALSGDGYTMVTGGIEQEMSQTNSGSSGSGVVRVFHYDEIDDVWEQIGDDLRGEAAGDRWGFSVSTAFDGRVVAGGARPPSSVENVTGYVRVFEYA